MMGELKTMIELHEEGPRIYNLYPRLVDSIDNWGKHLDRIENMGFNWVYVNPLSYTGFSGSLYAIKDYFKMNPLFAPADAEDPTSWAPLVEFIDACHARGLRFMYDLVINHTSIDSDLVQRHPEWFIWKHAVIEKSSGRIIKQFPLDAPPCSNEYPPETYKVEKRVANPQAIDPSDSRKVTTWGDLAEIDDEGSIDMLGLLEYWKKLISFYLELKMDGFRCDAAYQVPSKTWKILIDHAKGINPRVLFTGETLGCTLDQVQNVTRGGFDFIYNSSKWWDFTASWCPDQYNQFKEHAPSISFPESHDTPRLARESSSNVDYQVFRYLFAACFSAGTMMPIGYEFGFRKKLDVVRTKPSDWEPAAFDISSYIKHANKFKSKIACLNEDGPMLHENLSGGATMLLRKATKDINQYLLLIYNKDWEKPHEVSIDDMSRYLDLDAQVYQINLFLEGVPLDGNTWQKMLQPNEHVFFFQDIGRNLQIKWQGT
ncbi:alpha-amylase [Candidatus Bathyarchaeota archaeon]|nr:alpha-amylase [Candidatus Bathyarchaeota archaeon]